MSFDFTPTGPTRGMFNPPRGPDGQVFQPYHPQEPAALIVDEVRKHLGLTVAEFAGELRVSERTVWRWQQGHPVPPAMQRLMEVLLELKGGGK